MANTRHSNKKLTSVLQEKITSKLNKENNQDVYIREIIVTNAKGVRGEFMHPFQKSETKNATIKRMIKLIEQIVDMILPVHLENFNDQQTLKPARINYVTRVSLTEFALFPHKDAGPLNLDEYHELLRQLDEMGRLYPENLHINAGTVPVLYPDHVVRNTNIYLSIGKKGESSIHTFVKANPYETDPIYPVTKNIEFTTAYSNDWLKACQTKLDNIRLKTKGNVNDLVASLKEMDAVLRSNQAITIPVPPIQLSELRKSIIVAFETLKNIFTMGKTANRPEDIEAINKSLQAIFDNY